VTAFDIHKYYCNNNLIFREPPKRVFLDTLNIFTIDIFDTIIYSRKHKNTENENDFKFF